MVLQDLGRRISTAVQDLSRAQNFDEKVGSAWNYGMDMVLTYVHRLSMA